MWDPGRTPLKGITSKLLKQTEKTSSKRPELKGMLCPEEWSHGAQAILFLGKGKGEHEHLKNVRRKMSTLSG